MSYLVIDDFKLGMDRRRARIAGQLGALWTGVNGHITRGGDFERRKKFVLKHTLPVGTHGLAVVNNQLYTFGSIDTPSGLPAAIKYQKLAHTGSSSMKEILDWTSFDGKLYVVAEFENGDIYHYYNGSRVTAWDTVAAAVATSLSFPAARLAEKIDRLSQFVATSAGAVVTISSAIPGRPINVSVNTVNAGGGTGDQAITLTEIQPNVEDVAEVRATGTILITGGSPGSYIDSVTVNGIDQVIPTIPIFWPGSSADMAELLATRINSWPGLTDYTAQAVGASVVLTAAAGTGATPNGFVIAVSSTGITTSIANMAGGVTATEATAQVYTATLSGTLDMGDEWYITVSALPLDEGGTGPELLSPTLIATTTRGSGTGKTCLTFQKKIYTVVSSLMYFSKLSDPTDWSGTGSGFINMADQNEGSEPLTTVQEYQGKLAIFSANHIRVWTIDVDPTLNALAQTVPNTGTIAPQSVCPYGNIDVFYLATSGVRSLRARDSSNAPSVNDIGVAIDEFVQDFYDEVGDNQLRLARGIIEPRNGSYWLAIDDRIFVLSFFQGTKINAWTYYDIDEVEGYPIEELVTLEHRVYMRANRRIYLYGGEYHETYPDDGDSIAELSTPFFNAKSPATPKDLTGFDIGCEGVWDVAVLPDPANDAYETRIGKFYKPTYSKPRAGLQGTTAMFALKATCSKAGYARISNMAVHYESEKAE